MKAHMKALGGRITLEVQGEDAKALFKELASAQEIFGAADQCGCCHGINIRFNVRVVDSFTFYELSCLDCHAAFQFGQRKDDKSLFPKRKDSSGNWLDNNGWSIYEHTPGY